MSVPRPIDVAYRAMLVAYPAAFRERHGTAMMQMFRDAYRRAAMRGRFAHAVFLARSAGDITVNGFLERATPLRDRFNS